MPLYHIGEQWVARWKYIGHPEISAIVWRQFCRPGGTKGPNRIDGKVHIDIEIVSDVVCPWCYLGQQRLKLALEEVKGLLAADIAWKPYQLDPNTPPEGVDTFDYLAKKIGGPERVKRSHDMLTKLGEEIGLPFALEQAEILPNTLDAHRLLHWAGNDRPRKCRTRSCTRCSRRISSMAGMSAIMRRWRKSPRHAGMDRAEVGSASRLQIWICDTIRNEIAMPSAWASAACPSSSSTSSMRYPALRP